MGKLFHCVCNIVIKAEVEDCFTTVACGCFTMKRRLRCTLPQGKYWWSLAVVLMMLMTVVVEACYRGCQCTMVGTKKKQKGKRMDCSKHAAPLTSIEHITYQADTMLLDLTQNQLTLLKKNSFIQLSMLRKLNLSHNEISIIEPGTFDGLQNLRHLDLSFNKIGTVNSSMFTGLPKLEKLWLNQNHINTIPDGTFNDLTALRRIDFGSEYLRCDCHLRWVVTWAKSKKVRLAKEILCALPSPMQGRLLRKLEAEQLHCEHDLQLPLFEIKPSHSQLVFEGDKLPFECRATIIHPRTDIAWVREQGKVVIATNKTAGVFVHTSYTPDRTIIIHSLVVENLEKSHEGIWTCQVTTPQGNVTKHVEVEVLSYEGISCPARTLSTPKGRYSFKEMLAGVKAKVPCEVGGPENFVTYTCDRNGEWVDLNTSACGFTSDLTRSLQKLSQEEVNITDVEDYIERLQHVAMTSKHRFVAELGSNDIHYLAKITQKCLLPLSYTSQYVADNLLWLSSNISALTPALLAQAQTDTQATKKILDMLHNFSTNVEIDPSALDWSLSSRNIAIMVLRHVQLTASRIHCSLSRTPKQSVPWQNSRQFECSRLGNSTENRHIWNEKTDVSVDLPTTLLQDMGVYDDNNTGIFITVFRNGRLFPSIAPYHTDAALGRGNWTVVSSVVSVSVGHPVPNLTEPVVLVLRTGDTENLLKAAYWDFSANSGLGDWRTDGCKIVERKGNHTLLHVYHLSYFAVIEDVSEKVSIIHMEPVIYIGSGVCIICMVLVFCTYAVFFRSIVCPKKLKHSVINISLSVAMLLAGFVLGINRTDVQVPCQMSGICIHYFTLATTFWITITANNMFKKFTKAGRPPPPPPEPVSMPLPPKPILRFYFLGWGVPIIICGITAAVNLNHYVSTEYCFLDWEPSLGAFYAPMGLLIILNLIIFLRISCVVHAQSGQTLNDSDETEEVHTNEIELVPSQPDTNLDVNSIGHQEVPNRRSRSMANGGAAVRRSVGANSRVVVSGRDDDDEEEEEDNQSTVSLPDAERRPITQLRALVATLLLYIVMWVCGALAVARPFDSIIPYQDIIFSYLFSLVSIAFGIFMLAYFCIMRTDSSTNWKRICGCGPPSSYTGPVATEQPPAQSAAEPSTPTPQTPPTINGNQPNGSVVKSSSNLDVSVYSQKSSNLTKACNMKNNVHKQTNNSNINLVSLPASSLTEVSCGSASQEGAISSYPNFYNPRQNGAARKFWSKHRQHKILNKDINKDINSSLTDNNFSGPELSRSEANTHVGIGFQNKDVRGGGRNLSSNYDNASATSSNPNLSRQNYCRIPSLGGPYKNNSTTVTAALISSQQQNAPTPSPLGYRTEGGGGMYVQRGAHSPSPSARSLASSNAAQHQSSPKHLPQHKRTPSACSLGASHPSAFTPVQPRGISTLPRQSKLDASVSSSSPCEGGSVGGIGGGFESCGVFVDGPGGVPATVGPPPPPAPAQFGSGFESCVPPGYLSSNLCNIPLGLGNTATSYGHFGPTSAALARSISPVVSGMHGFMYYPHLPPPFHQQPVHSPAHSYHSTNNAVSGGESSDASSRHLRRHSRYSNHSGNMQHATSCGVNSVGAGVGLGLLGEVEQGSKSPVVSDITATPSSHEGHFPDSDQAQTQSSKNARSFDSDHHSDPTHRKKHWSRDKYGHHRRSGQGGLMTKQRSLGWEEQFKDRPAKIAYAYVNHNYRDKVMTKLIKQASESDELAQKAFWLPRSLSEYDRLTQTGFCAMAEDSSSSSDEEDSIDNVWLPQTEEKSDIFKKETSV